MSDIEAIKREEEDALKRIEASLERMLVGQPCEPIPRVEGTLRINRVIDLINMLSSNFEELAQFTRDIGKGNLDVEVPSRRNYLAAPLKDLHSQLSSFAWTAGQVQKGHVVDALEYMGELSDVLNGLISRVSDNGRLPLDEESADGARRQYQQILLALNRLPLMVIVTDMELNVLFANTPAVHTLGKLRRLNRESESPLEAALCANSEEGRDFPIHQEVLDERQNIWYKISSDLCATATGAPVFLHSAEDISAWKLNERTLERSATRDPLTGVFNRAIGIKTLEMALADKDRVTSCVAFIDVDKLKHVNDCYGHSEGDYVIETVAHAFASSLRDSDVVSRIGGDEFLVVFNSCQIDAAERVIARVREKITAVNESGGKPYTVSFSHGVAQVDGACDLTALQIINLTDKKMYEHKKGKKEG